MSWDTNPFVMKNALKISLLLLASAVLHLSSHAVSPVLQLPALKEIRNGASYTAELHTFNFDGDTLRSNLNGTVVLDLENNEITLNITQRITSCPRKQMCIQAIMPSATIVISSKLPIVEKNINECGEVTFVAKRDLRDMDGNLEIVRVIDRSNTSCENHASSSTEVIYESIENRTGRHLNYTVNGSELSLNQKIQPIEILQ